MGIGAKTVWLDVTRHGVHAFAGQRSGPPSEASAPLVGVWGVAELEDAVRVCLEQLAASKARVDVFWRCDGSSSTVVQTPVVGKTACDAGVLAELESGGVNTATELIEAEVLASSAEGSRVLIGHIASERYALLRQAVEDAGAKLGRVFAGESFAARAAVLAVKEDVGDDPFVTLALGDDASAIAISVGGNTRLVRFADVGLSAMASAYASVARKDDAGARELLHRFGVPGFNDDFDGGIRGLDVLRVMQPALQRLGVELKQSIRFQLAADEQFRVRLRIVGPGAGVRGLHSVLAEQLEIDAESVAQTPSRGDLASSWVSLPALCGMSGRAGVREYSADGDATTAHERAWWGGVAMAAAVVGAVGGLASYQTQVAERELAKTYEALDALHASAVTHDEQRSRIAGDALARAVREVWGTSADHGAALRLVATALNDDVRIESLRAVRTSNATSVALRARAGGDDADSARNAMKRFVGELDASDLTSSVDVGSVRLIDEPTRTFASFEITIALSEIEWAWVDALAGGAQ